MLTAESVAGVHIADGFLPAGRSLNFFLRAWGSCEKDLAIEKLQDLHSGRISGSCLENRFGEEVPM